MQDQQLTNDNRIPLNGAISNTIGGIGYFISGLFRLNAKSAAIVSGGLILGVLSGIPVIGWGCFLFAFVLGAFAVSLYVRHSTQPAQYSDGLVVGALTGVFASFIQFLITLVLAVIYLIFKGLSSASQPQPQNPWMTPNSGLAMLSAIGAFGWMIVSSLALFVPIILLAMLGGLLGVVWFETRNASTSQ